MTKFMIILISLVIIWVKYSEPILHFFQTEPFAVVVIVPAGLLVLVISLLRSVLKPIYK